MWKISGTEVQLRVNCSF